MRFSLSLLRVQQIEATAGPPIVLFTLFLRVKKLTLISLLASPFRETIINLVVVFSFRLKLIA